MVEVTLIALALVAGVTGAWSPCGFSMVETLAPSGYAGRMRVTVVACTTFALGALGGGVVTFGGLALLGSWLGAAAPAIAALIALAAAAGEARGARIMPQVRRQVPESWRRVMPVPLAAGLYGVLLGLGFTTFILTFAVWALAGVSVALGDPELGLVIGLAFGVGRTLPVVILAPFGGGAAHAAMAEQPRILRGLRLADAAALAVVAVALFAAPAQAQVSAAAIGFADPSVDGQTLALHRPGGVGELRGPTVNRPPVTGNHPAVGGGHTAWIEQGHVIIDAAHAISAPAADSVAVSSTFVVWRQGTELWAASLAELRPRQAVVGRIGRPALSGNLLVYDVDGRIESLDLATGVRTMLRREARAQLRGPSIVGLELTYVRATYTRQQVRVGRLRPQRVSSDAAIYGTYPTARRDAGHEPNRFPAKGHINKPLWERPPAGVQDTLTTTAGTSDAIYVTRVRKRPGETPFATVLVVPRVAA
ncbi:hypothetical protein OJ997_01910 [Solirubrobacter phytolaccae]|uniref:Cytochrome C biogenesis protein transmembrane domain-containing protein n=1 Tax=Solirubrobacter phytolaccae TaxID=1404360 RepID=A0A9X3N676_9ACTN|nr:hypothetical protein [Solirubrobacter phytolaccae]MDA0179034.1 hypothetical protein [Solirubrobacter phytolaccae]